MQTTFFKENSWQEKIYSNKKKIDKNEISTSYLQNTVQPFSSIIHSNGQTYWNYFKVFSFSNSHGKFDHSYNFWIIGLRQKKKT